MVGVYNKDGAINMKKKNFKSWLKQSIKILKKRKFFFISLFGVLIALVVFSQFYNVVVVKKQKPVLFKSAGERSNQNQGSLNKADLERLGSLINLDVDLNNLSEEELSAVHAFLKFRRIKASFIPSGTPEVYGAELGISFDSVQKAIDKVARFGPTYGEEKIELSGQEFERYKQIASQTSCKYCCGAPALIDQNGRAACGCAHSQMMRGLAAYLIKNHGNLSNQQILDELNAWRAVFFPKQTLAEKMDALEKQGVSGIKEVLEEFPEFLPDMVGGC
jgi:hypothetical protein